MQFKVNIINIFYKGTNGFMIGNAKIIEADKIYKEYKNTLITFSGDFLEIHKENYYLFFGDFIEHPKYGFQLKVDRYEKIIPEGKNAIVSFLSSGLFPGIGIRTAIKIAEHLGDNALDLIIEDYNRLLGIPNMSKNKAIGIYNVLVEEKESYSIILHLQNLGFSFIQSSKIYQTYKLNTIDIINDNIYKIIEDVENIGFVTTDRIALSLGIESENINRIYSGISYCIYNYCMNTGNTYAEMEDIYSRIENILNIKLSKEDIEYYLFELNKNNKIIIIDNKYILKDFYDSELYISNRIKELNNIKNNISIDIKKLENKFNIKYNKEQKDAIEQSLKNNFTIITGGPGTGKTTVIKGIVELYKEINNINSDDIYRRISLLAPTGRAAKRIRETSDFYAMTIHKFLKYNKETNSFGINENNISNIDFLIVDESSMLDIFLFKSLLEGLKEKVQIVLIGDYNQLPSILPGEILKDLINSENVFVTKLKKLYRQDEDSYLIDLSNEIKEGKLTNYLDTKKDYSFIECDKYEIKQKIIHICKQHIKDGKTHDTIQILIPMYKGINGIDNINKILQEVFNPKSNLKNEFEYNNVIYREKDKILQTKNISDYDVSNGDLGTIKNIFKDRIYIDFDGELVEYNKTDFENVKLGYAISIHKAQGSEFDFIILPMDGSYQRMLYRKLLYTAVTRTRKKLVIIGSSREFLNGVNNIQNEKRKTLLKNLISDN